MVHIPYRRELEFDYGTVTQLAPAFAESLPTTPARLSFMAQAPIS